MIREGSIIQEKNMGDDKDQGQGNLILQFLRGMDPGDDSIWTANGLPLVEHVSKGLGREVTRKDITDSAPNFTRGMGTPQGSGPEEIDDVPVMEKPMLEVLRSKELTERALREIEKQCMETMAEKKKVDEKLTKLFEYSQLLTRNAQRLHQVDPDASQRPIQDYLSSQVKAAEEKAARNKAFLAASGGMSMQEMQKALETRSPLAVSMAMRKPALGSQRPTPRAPIGAESTE